MDKVKQFINKHPIVYTLIIILLVIFISGTVIYIINENIEKNSKETENAKHKNRKSISDEHKPTNKKDDENKSIDGSYNSTVDEANQNKSQGYNSVGEIINTTPIKDKDQEIINYFNEQDRLTDNNNPTAREKLKNGFSNIYNFLFNGGTIKGVTFRELRVETKLKIIEKSILIDYKINKKFPDYKNNIKGKYNDLKNKASEKYIETTNEICASNESLCNSAKENYQTMKKSFSLTFDFVKERAKEGKDKIKSWWNSRK